MTLESLVGALQDADVMLPLLLSVASGALIGLEREVLGKPAGLRTHTLVCFASALVTLLGLRMGEWTFEFPDGTQIITDMARMPHAILTGIGFLGAGVIFRSKLSVQGLTTAASLWLTASLGIVYGAGLLELALIGTGIALLVLVFLRVMRNFAPPQPVIRLEVVVSAEDTFDSTHLAKALSAHGLKAGSPTIRTDRQRGLRRYTLLASAHELQPDCESISRSLLADSQIQELTIIPLQNEGA